MKQFTITALLAVVSLSSVGTPEQRSVELGNNPFMSWGALIILIG